MREIHLDEQGRDNDAVRGGQNHAVYSISTWIIGYDGMRTDIVIAEEWNSGSDSVDVN